MTKEIQNTEVNKIEEFKKSMGVMRDESLKELADLSSKEESQEFFEKLKTVTEEEIDKMTGEEVAVILGKEIDENLNKKVVSVAKRIQFKKDYMKLLKSYDTLDAELDTLSETFQKDQEAGRVELQKLVEKLKGTSLTDNLDEIINNADTKEEQKEKAMLMKQALVEIGELKLIKDALLFKGDKLRREYKKEYDKYKIRINKLTKNSKTYFINPEKVEEMMFSVYPEKKEQCKLVLYVLFRHYGRTKNISEKDAIELNYYIIAIMSLNNKKKSVSFDNIAFGEELANIINKLVV